MAPNPGEISPHLLPFLLAQMGAGMADPTQSSSKNKRSTKAGLLPQAVGDNVFSGIKRDTSGSYNALATIRQGAANTRADKDALHQTRMAKKAQAAAEAAARKQQAAYLKQQKEMYNKLAKLVASNRYSGSGSSNYSVPYIPPSSNGSTQSRPILPKIQPNAPQVAPMPEKFPYNYGDTHIGPAPEPKNNCPLWKKLLGMC